MIPHTTGKEEQSHFLLNLAWQCVLFLYLSAGVASAVGSHFKHASSPGGCTRGPEGSTLIVGLGLVPQAEPTFLNHSEGSELHLLALQN